MQSVSSSLSGAQVVELLAFKGVVSCCKITEDKSDLDLFISDLGLSLSLALLVDTFVFDSGTLQLFNIDVTIVWSNKLIWWVPSQRLFRGGRSHLTSEAEAVENLFKRNRIKIELASKIWGIWVWQTKKRTSIKLHHQQKQQILKNLPQLHCPLMISAAKAAKAWKNCWFVFSLSKKSFSLKKRYERNNCEICREKNSDKEKNRPFLLEEKSHEKDDFLQISLFCYLFIIALIIFVISVLCKFP